MYVFEKTFDTAAADYEQSRPAYVKEIYEVRSNCISLGPGGIRI